MSIKKVLFNVFIIMGSLIGGGLATGKELVSFFCCFGSNFWIPCLTSILMFYVLMKLISNINFTNANKVTEFAFFCFRLLIASVMVSSIKEICKYVQFSEMFYILILNICFILMFANFKIFSKIFSIIIPFIVISLIFISIATIILFDNNLIANNNSINTILNGMSYSALNIFLLIYIIKKCFNESNIKEVNLSIIISTLFMGILLMLYSFAILKSEAVMAEIPLLNIALNINKNLFFPVLIIIVLAIISTFIGISYDLSNYLKINTNIRSNFVTNSILFSICLIVSNIGFNTLIDRGYKILGILAIIYFCYVFIKEKVTCKNASDNGRNLSLSSINNLFNK